MPGRRARLRDLYRVTALALLPILAATPALTDGPNTSNPNTGPPPPTPTPVITDTPQLNTVGAGGCQQQYTAALNSLYQSNIDAINDGLAANAIGAAAAVTGATAQQTAADAAAVEFGVMAGGFTAASIGLDEAGTAILVPLFPEGASPGLIAAGVGLGTADGAAVALATSTGAEAVALAAEIVGLGSTVVGINDQITAQGFSQQWQDLSAYQDSLPDCNIDFTGTVTVQAGGVNVTGESRSSTTPSVSTVI